MLSCESCEIPNNTFFTEHLWTTASGKGVSSNFTRFAGKHLCHSQFIKKETLEQLLFREISEISKNTFITE